MKDEENRRKSGRQEQRKCIERSEKKREKGYACQ